MHHSDPTERHPIATTAAPPAAPTTEVSAPVRMAGSGATALDTLAPWAGGIGGAALTLTVVLVLAHRIVRGATQLAERLRSRSDGSLGRRPTRDHPVVPVALLTGLGATLTTWVASGTAGAVNDSGSQRLQPVAPTSVPLLRLVDDPGVDGGPGSRPPAAPPGPDTDPATTAGTPTLPDTATPLPPAPRPPAPSTAPPSAIPPSAIPQADAAPDPWQPDTGTPATTPGAPAVPAGTSAEPLRSVGPPSAPSVGDPGGGGGGQRPTHTVQAGEHLWGIASGRLRFVTGTPPGDRAVVDYWLRLIEANLDRLPDPDDPDLIHPGLVLVLPEPGPIGVTSR